MLVDERHNKLVEAISYFVTHTKYCGLIKLFKLLYWLDYHHFRETGHDVTGLSYFAYPMGPVPAALYDQFTNRSGDVANQFVFEANKSVDDEYQIPTMDSEPDGAWVPRRRWVPAKVRPLKGYSHKYLTRREMRIAAHLAEIFNEVSAKDISDISHIRGGPWQKALKTGGERSLIDFSSALVPMQKGEYLAEEELRERVKEEEDVRRALS